MYLYTFRSIVTLVFFYVNHQQKNLSSFGLIYCYDVFKFGVPEKIELLFRSSSLQLIMISTQEKKARQKFYMCRNMCII